MVAAVHGGGSEAERLRRFGEELDALKRRMMAKLGAEDVRRVRRLDRLSRGFEVIGRVLIHVSFEPVSFVCGVLSLAVHKQLQAAEIGHTVLHGTYDRLAGGEAYAADKFSWDIPVDEEAWRHGHNVRHHGLTNVAGSDADIQFGPVRFTEHAPWSPQNRTQVWFLVLVLVPCFGALMNVHFTGLSDHYFDNGRQRTPDFLADRSPASLRAAWRRAGRKYIPYYLKNYVLFPALAGPGFGKVLLGNWLAEKLRDFYFGLTIVCGHVNDYTPAWPEGTRVRTRGEWYAHQAEAANNLEVRWPFTILCGGLEHQIEHHLFPLLPPQRLRAIAPEVREICERHGVGYRSGSWPRALWNMLRHVHSLSAPQSPINRR